MSAEPPSLDLVRALRRSARRAGDVPAAETDWNPFAADRIRPGARPWVTFEDPPSGRRPGTVEACLADALATPLGFIVGSHGSGKSTLLRHVVGLATDRGLRVAVVHAGGALPAPADLARLDLAVTDAAGRLRPTWWLRLILRARRAGTPVLATARREWVGRTVHRRRVTPEEAAAVVADCLQGTGAATPPLELLGQRLREADGSLRDVLRGLSDAWEDQEPLADGWPGHA